MLCTSALLCILTIDPLDSLDILIYFGMNMNIYYLSGKFNMLPFHELGIVLDVLQLFLTKLIDLIYKSNTGT